MFIRYCRFDKKLNEYDIRTYYHGIDCYYALYGNFLEINNMYYFSKIELIVDISLESKLHLGIYKFNKKRAVEIRIRHIIYAKHKLSRYKWYKKCTYDNIDVRAR